MVDSLLIANMDEASRELDIFQSTHPYNEITGINVTKNANVYTLIIEYK